MRVGYRNIGVGYRNIGVVYQHPRTRGLVGLGFSGFRAVMGWTDCRLSWEALSRAGGCCGGRARAAHAPLATMRGGGERAVPRREQKPRLFGRSHGLRALLWFASMAHRRGFVPS